MSLFCSISSPLPQIGSTHCGMCTVRSSVDLRSMLMLELMPTFSGWLSSEHRIDPNAPIPAAMTSLFIYHVFTNVNCQLLIFINLFKALSLSIVVSRYGNIKSQTVNFQKKWFYLFQLKSLNNVFYLILKAFFVLKIFTFLI